MTVFGVSLFLLSVFIFFNKLKTYSKLAFDYCSKQILIKKVAKGLYLQFVSKTFTQYFSFKNSLP
jgi:hypothetical protein